MDKALRRHGILYECKKLFDHELAEDLRPGIVVNGLGSLEERFVGGGELSKMYKIFLKRCIVTTKAVVRDEEETSICVAVREKKYCQTNTFLPESINI